MKDRLKGKHIAFVAGQGVEYSHLFKPMQDLKSQGAQVSVISTTTQHLVTDTRETHPVHQGSGRLQ